MTQEDLQKLIGEDLYGKMSDEAKKYLESVGDAFGNEFTSEDIAKIIKSKYGI